MELVVFNGRGEDHRPSETCCLLRTSEALPCTVIYTACPFHSDAILCDQLQAEHSAMTLLPFTQLNKQLRVTSHIMTGHRLGAFTTGVWVRHAVLLAWTSIIRLGPNSLLPSLRAKQTGWLNVQYLMHYNRLFTYCIFYSLSRAPWGTQQMRRPGERSSRLIWMLILWRHLSKAVQKTRQWPDAIHTSTCNRVAYSSGTSWVALVTCPFVTVLRPNQTAEWPTLWGFTCERFCFVAVCAS